MTAVQLEIARPPRPVLRYHGGKYRLAMWIVANLPAHTHYVEPFCGAASILLAKPRVEYETINDLDDEIVNIFRVLRDPIAAAALRKLLHLTPFAKQEFVAAYERVDDPTERARRAIIRSFMAFGGGGVNPDCKTGFRGNSPRSRRASGTDWSTYGDAIPFFTERLRGVEIENAHAFELFRRYDGPSTLFYCDPPYMQDTRNRGGKATYSHEMTHADHVTFLDVVTRLQGKVVISMYPHARYADALRGWTRLQKRTIASGQRRSVERQEVLWLSPNCIEVSA